MNETTFRRRPFVLLKSQGSTKAFELHDVQVAQRCDLQEFCNVAETVDEKPKHPVATPILRLLRLGAIIMIIFRLYWTAGFHAEAANKDFLAKL